MLASAKELQLSFNWFKLTKMKHREHITPALASLHYLPVEFKIKYKTVVITYQVAPQGEVAEYIFHFVWALVQVHVAT